MKTSYVKGVYNFKSLEVLSDEMDSDTCNHPVLAHLEMFEDGDRVVCPKCNAVLEVIFDQRFNQLVAVRIL